MKTRYIILLTALLLVMSGCASKKKIAEGGKKEKTTQVETAKNEVSNVEVTPIVTRPSIPAQAIAAQPDFVSVYAPKAKCTINYSGRQISSGGTITLIKDSILIISVQPLLGIELVRVEATQTEVLFLDKMNKRYAKMAYAELAAETGLAITFNDIQAIAMDRMFVVGKDQAFIKEQKDITSKGGMTTLKIAEGRLNYTYTINEKNLALLSTLITMEGKTAKSSIAYSGHMVYTDGITFPNTIQLSYTGGKTEGSAVISLPSIIFNGSVNATRANLRPYTQTTLNTIISGK